MEDNPGDAELVREYFADAGTGAPTLDVVVTLSEALDALGPEDEASYDAALLDLNLPDSKGLSTLRSVLDDAPEIPVIILTGSAEHDLGVEAVRMGAQDFLPKGDLTPLALARVLRYAIERKRIMDQLRKSRDRFRAMFEAGPHGAVVGRDGVIERVNPQLEKTFGYEPGELEGKSVEVLVPERFREAHEGHRRGYSESPHVRPMGVGLELRGLRKDGSEFPVEISLSPYREAGELRILTVVQDISERVEKERHIRFQAELLDAVGQAVIVTDMAGRVEYWNRAAEELYGWRADEAVGQDITTLTPSEQSLVQARQIMDQLREGESWTGEFEVRRKDGSTFPALVTNAPLVDEEGRLSGIIGVSTDITELVEIREDLAHSNRALRVVSAANQAVLRSESEEEILNEACRIAVEEGGYRFAWIGFAEDDPDRTIRPVAWKGVGEEYVEGLDVRWSTGERGQGPTGRAIRAREPAVVQDIRSHSGFEPWREDAVRLGYRSSAAIPLVDQGLCLGALNIYSDEAHAFDEHELEILSELGSDLAHGLLVLRAREKEEALHEKLQESEKLRAVGQLAGGVAHDFNNYLTVITTLTDLLLRDPDLDHDRARDLREIQMAAERSSLLTRQLLTFSRRDIRVPRVLDVNETVRETVDMLGRLLGEKVEVELDLDPQTPPVMVDRGQLEQVIMNMAINARDAMPGGGRLEIRTSPSDSTDFSVEPTSVEEAESRPRVLLEVSDTGVGMAPEIRNRIFEPFFTTKETGTGLGLATVYGIVTEAGGELQVESEVGGGTTFRMIFPGVAASPLEEAPAKKKVEDLTGTETVLVVEDEAPVRSVCRRILERQGYQVLEARTARDAIDLSEATTGPIDLALIDMSLPDGTGSDVARTLRAQRSDLTVVFTSGYSAEDVASTLEDGSRARYLEKPYGPERLVRVVRSALETSNEVPQERA